MTALHAAALGALCFVCYNLNGREMGSYDSQPSKFLAREIVLRHTLTLDATVAAVPQLAERPGFVKTADGHYRSAYSIVPALAASVVAWPLAALRIIDLDGPLSMNLVAKLTASLLASLTVALAFLTARRFAADGVAALVTLGFGLGTNVWALASQTLWQHESVLAGLTLALFCLARPRDELRTHHLWVASAGLGIAGWARPQVAAAVAVLALCLVARHRRASALLALAPLALCGALAVGINLTWFGHPLGATPLLEALHPQAHRVEGSIARDPWRGALGLLFSPSRGLVIFSPIVLIALGSIRRAWQAQRDQDADGVLLWCWLAAVAQFSLYACYTVWWGGHTYGPRYPIDLLPLLVPLGAVGAARLVRTRAGTIAGAAALAWSILLAGTGAWCYPAEAWNTDPMSVDWYHERLWDWRDPQFVRAWQRGSSPQNFSFLEPGAFTAPNLTRNTAPP